MAAPKFYQGMRTVYDSVTGEPVSLNPVDARQRVAAGLAKFDPPVIPEPEPVIPEPEAKVRKARTV